MAANQRWTKAESDALLNAWPVHKGFINPDLCEQLAHSEPFKSTGRTAGSLYAKHNEYVHKYRGDENNGGRKAAPVNATKRRTRTPKVKPVFICPHCGAISEFEGHWTVGT